MPKQLRRSIALLVGFVLVLVCPGRGAFAFHEAGVAACSSCHVMHRSEDGQTTFVGEDLLRGESSSDLCLSCHADAYGETFNISPLVPGTEFGAGNFIFLLEDDINDTPDPVHSPIHGEAAGHSVVAPSLGLQPDSRHVQSPGGSFPSTELECTSCHDPHGNQNFRMLRGVGWVKENFFYFSAPAPDAEGPSVLSSGESAGHHTAYRDGWADWCGNCHGSRYHRGSTSRFHHPGDHSFDQEQVDQYADYDGDQNPSGGSSATAYLVQVPFEDLTATVDMSSGPSGASRLTCISCHRVHASSAPAAGRWDFNVDRLGDDGVPSGSYPLANPYADPAQRQLCVKCHDTRGHDQGRGCLDCHRTGGGGHGGPDIGID